MKLSIHLKAKSQGEYYVYISLSHKSKRVLIATSYTIGEEYVKDGKIINKAKYAEIYNKELLKYEERLGYIVAPELLDLATIKDIITTTRREEATVVEFFSAAQEHIERIKSQPERARTARVYELNIDSFRKYTKRNKVYTFEMTSKMIQGYVDHLIQEGQKPTTIRNKIAAVKTIFNAVKDCYNDYDTGVLVIKNDPFKRVVIPQVTRCAGEKALSVKDIRQIINYKPITIKGYTEYILNNALDYFLLSFYLLGINPVDMYNLKKSQYKDGRIVYSRSKTKRRAGGSEISIPVCLQAALLINKHSGKDEYLFDFREKYSNIETMVTMMHRSMSVMYSQLKLSVGRDSFTWYSARHTWASIAANECHFSDAEVARALNHQSEHKVTRGYIRPDWSLLDRMNEAVLDVVYNSKGAE